MLLRDDAYGAIVDIEPDSRKVTMAGATVNVKEVLQPALSDEIEDSEGDEADDEKLDEISDDSSNLDDEVPVATKLGAGRVRRRKVKSERGDGDDGGKRRARKAAPRDWLLKYLQPNVSNVADRAEDVNTGYGSMIVRASTGSARQRRAGCEDSSSEVEEQEQLPSVGRGQPEGTSVAQDEGGNADDEDFTDFEELPCTKRKEAGSISEKAKLKDQVGKTPATVTADRSHSSEGLISVPSQYSFTVVETQEDEFEISPRKPLAQNHQRDVEPVKGYFSDKSTPQTKERKQKENEAPRKRKLSLSKDSRRQLSLKSFMKPFPVQ